MNPNGPVRVLLVVIVAVAIAGGLLAWSGWRESAEGEPAGEKTSVTIDERLTRLMDAAQRGDADTWQACFIDRQPNARPALLKRTHGDLKGYAVLERRIIKPEREAVVVLEKVFAEHNERYGVRLRNVDGDWKIVTMTPLEKKAPKTRYGTPVVPGLKKK